MPRSDRAAASWILFLVPTSIWGTTWLTIKFQLGTVAPEVSVVYRFALAAVVLFAWCAAQGLRLRYDLRSHVELAAMGVLQFGLNYVLVYVSERQLTSGLVAVAYALIVVWNLAGARVFFGTPARPAMLVGAALGLAGVTLMFWPEVARVGEAAGRGFGLAAALLGSVFASAGNLWSQRLYRRGLTVAPSTAWAMAYASAAVALSCALRGIPFSFEATAAYVSSLAYLVLFGSVIAFLSYLTLLRRVGAGPAGYSAAVIPVVAMVTSTLFEGYRWTALALAGMALVVLGNVLVMGRPAHSRPPSSRSPGSGAPRPPSSRGNR
ncbi:MAG TPA: EamA family transporter [Anaeromyxobacter sp.]|nr:EamA family transporter [Anaeromyxobacter sp.]